MTFSVDSSDNSALHYAAAYGWINIVKLLLEHGANPNTLNQWKSSPTVIAMLKGHLGIVDHLISLKNVEISFRNDTGKTLIAQMCQNLNEDIYKNLSFLIKMKKVDPKLKDLQNWSPLHHLLNNDLRAIAKKAVEGGDDDEDDGYYTVFRRGKKIRRRRFRRRGNNDDNFNYGLLQDGK